MYLSATVVADQRYYKHSRYMFNKSRAHVAFTIRHEWNLVGPRVTMPTQFHYGLSWRWERVNAYRVQTRTVVRQSRLFFNPFDDRQDVSFNLGAAFHISSSGSHAPWATLTCIIYSAPLHVGEWSISAWYVHGLRSPNELVCFDIQPPAVSVVLTIY